MTLFLPSPFQKFDEDPDKWWYTTFVYKAVTETLHAVSTYWMVAFPAISIQNIRWRFWQLMIYNNRIWNCYWNTSCPSNNLGCRFSCHLHLNYSINILTIGDIQESYKKPSLKHFTPHWHIEVLLFLSSPLQIINEDPDDWCYTTIVSKAVAETLHALSSNWVVSFPVISISIRRWRSWELMIYDSRA